MHWTLSNVTDLLQSAAILLLAVSGWINSRSIGIIGSAMRNIATILLTEKRTG